MIGVIAKPEDEAVVREFFELFKTPWDFFKPGQEYDVVLCAGEKVDNQASEGASLVIVFAGEKIGLDERLHFETARLSEQHPYTKYRSYQIPLYGKTIAFPGESGFLESQKTRVCLGLSRTSGEKTLVRVGYDLFSEVRSLLIKGQPAINAAIPTLDLHIHILRDLIVSSGITLVEIPPVPEGYSFMACLTHDIDHPSIRAHQFDHTVGGFLYRALVGSLIDFVRGRTSLAVLVKNWVASLKLPAVFLGIAKDFWRDFADCYLETERGLPSTYFAIPFKGRPGKTLEGSAPKFRAARYGAADISDILEKISRVGNEIGLHGIDAWLDSSDARKELTEITRLTSKPAVGVRMHWLYFNDSSPAALEAAGAEYDSTIGYNDTVGYRAGTLQPYKHLGTTGLMELPLHAMDTALFYPSHLNLSFEEAMSRLESLANDASQFGGCITVNWHDRSIAPERNWSRCYQQLLLNLEGKNVWFATGFQATSWFRKRRSAVLELSASRGGTWKAIVPKDSDDGLPTLQVRCYNTSGANIHTAESRL
jgi:hypothetical protein